MSSGTNSLVNIGTGIPLREASAGEPVDPLAHRAGGILIGLAVVHVAYFLPAAVGALDDWVSGSLWTLDLDAEMTAVDAAFWALPGGFAVPLALLGLLVRRDARRGTPPSPWVGWGIGGWALLGSALSEPSGFPIALVPAAMLVASARRARRVAGGPAELPAWQADGVVTSSARSAAAPSASRRQGP